MKLLPGPFLGRGFVEEKDWDPSEAPLPAFLPIKPLTHGLDIISLEYIQLPFLILFFFFFLFLPHHVACRILVPRLRGLNPGPPAVRVWSPNHWPTREFPKILFCYKKFQEHIKESCIPTTPHTQHSNSVTTYIYHPVSVLCIKPSFFFSFFSKGFFFFNIVFIIMITSLESQRQRPWE